MARRGLPREEAMQIIQLDLVQIVVLTTSAVLMGIAYWLDNPSWHR